MNAETDKIHEAFVNQLSSFEDRLDKKVDDVKMLANIQDAIGRLLGNDGSNEGQIRRVLQDRYDGGHLRKETFQLVKSMLDRYVTEKIPTAPGLITGLAVNSSDALIPREETHGEPASNDDLMGSTQVIEPADKTVKPDSADATVQVGSVLRDRYMLQERIEGGSMGVVYKAMDRRLAESGGANSWVAVKILSPQLAANGHALRALQQEASKGRCLSHPNIVRFLDLDRDDDLYFIVMEWLEGTTLADILDSPDSGNIYLARAFKIVKQIGDALDYAHRCGIVHADVKPGNIMMLPNGDAKLFDFGVARVYQQTIEAQPGFDPGVLGLMTPAYSSMQVLTGETPTPADDVFSLACLLYRLIAGYRVFGPRNAAEAADEGMKPQRLQNISKAQWRVIKKALSYPRVTRFESMADFMEALDFKENDPITITVPVPARDDIEVEKNGPGTPRRIIGLAVLIGLMGVAEWQFGLYDRLVQEYASPEPAATALPPSTATAAATAPDEPTENVDAAGTTDATDAAGVEVEELLGPPVEETPLELPAPEPALQESADPVAIEEPEEIIVPRVDFSQLPAPTAEIRLPVAGDRAETLDVRLRENGRPVTIDLIRNNVDLPLALRLEEVGFSGNRSPWRAKQYSFTDNGNIEFPVGQNRARITLRMTPDRLREADQQSTLRLRPADSAQSELAIIHATLEDDDQRRFEATLPANTVSFATSQVSVRESDPAVQIDILRFNPDNTTLVVGYTIRDITATKGADYFSPGSFSIEFGPGQRTARLLIPLVQDSEYESNEAFSVELATADSTAGSDIFYRTAVMIRDDDI